MNILFQCNQLSNRGTEVAIYDYAHYCEELLGHNSIIMCRKNSSFTDPLVVEKFENRFKVIWYDHNEDQIIEKIVFQQSADLFYSLKSGGFDANISFSTKSAIHGVFDLDPHGDKWAVISEWLSQDVQKRRQINVPIVPHIVQLPETNQNLRERLNIPKGAFVVGRHGGYDQLDIPFVYNAIKRALDKRSDLYFLLLNTRPLPFQHERIIYLRGTADMLKKRMFINTCDVCLHGRALGESFGLAVAEFSICNKPVITYYGSEQRSHIWILANDGFYYNNENQLVDLLLNSYNKQRNYDKYSERFNPKIVMEQFKKVFID